MILFEILIILYVIIRYNDFRMILEWWWWWWWWWFYPSSILYLFVWMMILEPKTCWISRKKNHTKYDSEINFSVCHWERLQYQIIQKSRSYFAVSIWLKDGKGNEKVCGGRWTELSSSTCSPCLLGQAEKVPHWWKQVIPYHISLFKWRKKKNET